MKDQKKITVYINYGKDNFKLMYSMYKKFLESVPFNELIKDRNDRKAAGIIVAPRNNSGIPFCNLTIALIYLYKGYSVKIIWDDLMFLDSEMKYQNKLLGELIIFICQRTNIQYIRLSELGNKEIDTKDDNEIKRIANANAIWNVRKVVPSRQLEEYKKASYDVLKENAKKINYFYAFNKFDHCVHQSLINENGSLHKLFAMKNNQRIGSLDIAAGEGQMSTDDVPGYHSDLPKLLKDPIFDNDQIKKIAINEAKKEFRLRMYGKDSKGYQTVSLKQDDNKYKAEIIIPLNILWDAAALSKNRFFNTPFEWADKTIEFILKETSSSVVIRQHPAERKYKVYGTGDDLGKYLTSKYGHNSRFFFCSCYDDVNTYALVKKCKIVLPYTSSVGLEAALMGKKVIVESDVYYSNLPVVIKPKTKTEYFKEIKKAASKKIISDKNHIKDTDKEDAWLLYFLVHECPKIYSDFGLEPLDFQKWTGRGFNALVNDDNLLIAIDGLATNTPYAYVNCKRILERLEKRSCRVIEWPIENDEEIRQKLSEIIFLINNEKYNQALEVIEGSSSSFEDIYLYPKAFLLAKLGQTRKSKDVIDKLNKIKPDNQKAIDLRNEISMSIVKL